MPKTAPRTDTKNRLLQQARILFARHGYEGVSMRDIATAVGLRQSAIYNHFPSKQDLLVTLMKTHMEQLLAAVKVAISDQSKPEVQLEAFVRFNVMYHVEHPEDVFLAYMELRSLEDTGREIIMPLRDTYELVLRNILVEGKETGVFKCGDPAVTSRAILAMLSGVTVWFRADGTLGTETVADNYVQTVLRSVGAPVG